MCGDSTNADDVVRLMDGERATLLATDPPYLVDYQGGNHPQSWANKPDKKDKHWDDYRDPDAASAFFVDFLKVWLPHCVEGVSVYQWHATRRQSLVEAAWHQAGLLVHQTVIWVKARAVLTRSDYMHVAARALLLRMAAGQAARKEAARRCLDRLGDQPQDGIHPTQKPVEIFARPIRYHTTPGAICAEPLSGTGRSSLPPSSRDGGASPWSWSPRSCRSRSSAGSSSRASARYRRTGRDAPTTAAHDAGRLACKDSPRRVVDGGRARSE